MFFGTKNFLAYVVWGQFSKKCWKKFKKLLYYGLDEILIKIVKKFGVHSCIFQSTTDEVGLMFVVLHLRWCFVAYLFSVCLQIHKYSLCSMDYDIETARYLKSDIVNSYDKITDQYLVLPKY